MISIRPEKPSSEECRVLAEITSSAREGTPLESERSLDEISADIENISESDEFQILIVREEKGTILGWIYYYVGFPPMAFIEGFYPVVKSTDKTEEIALSIIEAAKRDTMERGYTRLENEMRILTDAHRAMSDKFVRWYEESGFKLATEEVHMRADLTSLSFPDRETPTNCVLRKFADVSYERLERAGFRIFENSKEALFLSMRHDERKVNLKYFFDVSRTFIDNASVILEQDDEIIGFVITRMREGEADIGPVGLVPEVRGRGIGSYLLASVLKTLQDSGVSNATLDTSLANHPARKLYQKHGFKDVYHKRFYYWSP